LPVEEGIEVHLVERDRIAQFVAERRAAGVAIDVKLLLLLAGSIL
jgi:ADP-ribose pyrophosphatase